MADIWTEGGRRLYKVVRANNAPRTTVGQTIEFLNAQLLYRKTEYDFESNPSWPIKWEYWYVANTVNVNVASLYPILFIETGPTFGYGPSDGYSRPRIYTGQSTLISTWMEEVVQAAFTVYVYELKRLDNSFATTASQAGNFVIE